MPTQKEDWMALLWVRFTEMLHCEVPRTGNRVDLLGDAGLPSEVQVGGDHYKGMAIQPAEYVTKNGIPFLPGNAIKYISRIGLKGDPIEQIEKAIHCLQIYQQILTEEGECHDMDAN